jgi:hypothetical protein
MKLALDFLPLTLPSPHQGEGKDEMECGQNFETYFWNATLALKMIGLTVLLRLRMRSRGAVRFDDARQLAGSWGQEKFEVGSR